MDQVKNLFWPMKNDKCWVLNSEVICLISTPTKISGRAYNISNLDLENIDSWLQKKLNTFKIILIERSEGGQLWIQEVSSTPATRMDVVNLQEQLDMRLQQRQARETGICPVRRELYSQAFDELIRQVTINCAERGLLLLRVRDEISMTIAAYQTLYESSIAFGMRKALQAEQGKTDMEQKINDLTQQKEELEKQVNELKGKCDAIEKRDVERRAIEEKKHSEEIQFLKKTNQQLKTQLEGIIAPSKR
ncbi:33 kDa inner dynein arm light chain, axonemal isoform X2 [Hydra vulgaris]|uniref:33 kDa inner dynein arm light chain, axonemal isoform X2 n=1 Tax=Hydra vulgaris TaxID=6087 RepID=UPI001F5F1326|nr:33 kDa inner dynein arm light chain, axonemal isoform X2 [Hydra vulgaris]